MDAELIRLIAQGGISAALIALIFYVGKSLIAEIKGMRGDIVEHTKVDLAHHAEVREAIVDLRARFDVMQDITPVEHPRHRTNPQGVPVGYYSRRPGTKDDR